MTALAWPIRAIIAVMKKATRKHHTTDDLTLIPFQARSGLCADLVRYFVLTIVTLAVADIALAGQRGGSQDPKLREATQLMSEGKADEAVALARQVVAASPDSYQANVSLGNLLDFAGKYEEARQAFLKASEVGPTGENKNRALRAIAISYGFEGNCPGVITYEGPLYDAYLKEKDFYNAGEVANELARLCFDTGSFDEAEAWYRKGTAAGLQEPDIKPERTDLWHYRLEHALGRIAARRGNAAEAQQHIAAAKALVDRGNMPAQQKEYLPYLEGFVALYTGDPQVALTDLLKGNQNDAYVLGLEAQAYEKLGQKDKATEYYGKVMRSMTHNPTTAGSRPLARKKLAGS
jgi:tetratricopeptide (TPR) repeat protein